MTDDGGGLSVRAISATLAVTVVLAALPALVLSFSTMRYLADWTIPLMLLATLGFWIGCAARAERIWPRRIWLTAGAVLMSITVLVGPLLGVTGALDQFARHNPALMKRMIEATYAGPVPGVAQVGGPAGVDLTDDGRRWWLGDRFAAVDVMADADGRYVIEFQATPAPGLTGHRRLSLAMPDDAVRPAALGGRPIGAAVLKGLPATAQPVRFSVPLKRGLNRLFLSVADSPSRADAAPLPNPRRLVTIADVAIRPEVDPGPAAAAALPAQ